jgi:ATP-dependent Clp protease ATP-binding subunit ClpC
MRGAMELLRFHPMSEEATATVVKKVAAQIAESTALTVEEGALQSVLHLSHQYLGSNQLPGTTLDLLKRSANHVLGAGGSRVTADNVLETLSQMSGLPRSILDDNQRLDLATVRDFFGARVIGQDEAVTAIVDRIAMLKAGLVDPGRPIGVFLFAGPTGTGKTELAKTLAAYLFGSADRMSRLDMSEFQTAESTVKILGTGSAEADSLAERIRRQPFSVVLLDEFEKAHPNAWDLFLQVFDDGRLTDAYGRAVDFRHTIIILTTNLGATTHQASIGFARSAADYSEEQILQAVGRTFRPEFVNRLDRIVVFRPLSRDFMRKILEKELAEVLERRGLRHRDWAVEWEDSAIAFLLDKGFSPDMGARPLRRAIDQHLLAPLAATMVEHKYPAGDQFLFVRSDGESIEVEFVDPDADTPAVAPLAAEPDSQSSLPQAILRASGEPQERKALGAARNARMGRA